MKILSQKENIPLDLNQNLRREGLKLLKKSNCHLETADFKELELWSCLLLKTTPFLDRVPRAVLVGDSHILPHFTSTEAYLELNQKLQSFMPTLFMAQTSSALNRGALPGERTLHSPLFPSLHTKAIASSQCVISFHLEPLLVAIANRVPVIFISGKETDETQLAKRMGVPVVVGQEPGKLVAEIEMYFTHYSWKKIDEFCEQIKRELHFPEIAKENVRVERCSSVFNVCTISDSSYFPFFLGFIENINQHSDGNFKCFLLALDAQVSQAVKKMKLSSKIEVIPIQDLWNSAEWDVIQKREVGNRAYSTKPRLISKALKHVTGPVFYCDSDVFFFENVSSLQGVVGSEPIVLFPHLNDAYPSAQLDGLYNAGMVAVAPGAETFLEWWSDCCLRECGFDRKRGVVGDQAYLNLVPVLFDCVKVYKGHNHNVARWNSKTLQLDLDPHRSETPIIEGGALVSTYHAAFCDERGIYQMKYLWDQLSSFFSPAYTLTSSRALASNVRYQQRIYWSDLDYVSKLDKFIQNHRVQKLVGKLNYDSSWWFTKKGHRWLKTLIFGKQLLNGLRIQGKDQTSSGESSTLSDSWVNSNLKALQKDPQPLPKTSKVA